MSSFGEIMRIRLGRARRLAVIGVGDELLPSDRLGMAVARALDSRSIVGVRVFFAGTMPENITGPVKEFQPDHILIADAAEMNAVPGSAAVIEPGDVPATLFSTHVIPLPVVMEYLAQATAAQVTLIGIQPDFSHTG
ncbi:MAG: hydrogenase maturation protease, partial [Methanomicrobiales archaeon]|nr:hydrogenase maturation protease [Methanomicrobiales archaeon]